MKQNFSFVSFLTNKVFVTVILMQECFWKSDLCFWTSISKWALLEIQNIKNSYPEDFCALHRKFGTCRDWQWSWRSLSYFNAKIMLHNTNPVWHRSTNTLEEWNLWGKVLCLCKCLIWDSIVKEKKTLLKVLMGLKMDNHGQLWINAIQLNIIWS